MTAGEQLTDAGRAFREEIEVRTDELERPLLDALADDLDELLEHLDAWSDAIIRSRVLPAADCRCVQRRRRPALRLRVDRRHRRPAAREQRMNAVAGGKVDGWAPNGVPGMGGGGSVTCSCTPRRLSCSATNWRPSTH
jgi:hypothetical protein